MKRKKSLVGWTFEGWNLWHDVEGGWINHSVISLKSRNVWKDSWRGNKNIKVRITLEEI